MKLLFIRHRHPLAGALAAGVLVSLLAVWPASAALFVILEPTAGPPGTDVTGRTGGEGAFASQVDPLPAYLAAKAAADAVTSPDDPRLIGIGALDVDATGNGKITFRVPQVEPGDYVVIVSCPSCAPFSAGRTIAPVADFRVTPSPPATDAIAVDPSGQFGPIAVIGWLLLVLLLGGVRQLLVR